MATTDLLLPPISGGGGGAADGGVLQSDPPTVTPDLIRGLPTVCRVATLPAKTFRRANTPQRHDQATETVLIWHTLLQTLFISR